MSFYTPADSFILNYVKTLKQDIDVRKSLVLILRKLVAHTVVIMLGIL